MIVKKLADGFHIYWKNNVLDKRAAVAARDFVWNLSRFAPLTQSDYAKMKKYADANGITVNQILSLKNTHIKDHIIRGYVRVVRNIVQLSQQYEKYGIISVSHKWHMPPVTLIRIIFEKKYPRTKFANVEEKLSPADKKQLELARAGDAETFFDNAKILELSQKYENDFAARLRKHGIPFRTQDDLTAEQTAAGGNAYATPDILFDEPVHIHVRTGKEAERVFTVRWVDLKDMCFMSGTFMDGKIREQSAKYNKLWGNGAFCFHYGYVGDVTIPGAIALGDDGM